MELWIDGVLIIIAALLIDRFIGELPNSVHPLRWMGNILGFIDRHISRRDTAGTSAIGFLSYLLVFVLFCGIALILTSLTRYAVSSLVSPEWGEIAWIIVTAFIFKITFAVFSFRHHCDPIIDDLENGETEKAAEKVQMIVSRNTKGMDPEHIASSCCETVSENLVDSVYSPVLYFGILGIPGAVMFRCANLMDAMWGYLNDKYARLGFFPAKFDDVLGFFTSRISPYFIAAAAAAMGLNWRAAVPAAREGHSLTPSPNSGWSMTAAAAVLDISMEKKGVYVMGTGPLPGPDDVRLCCRLIELASVMFILSAGLILYCLLGIHVQLLAENIFDGIWEALF